MIIPMHKRCLIAGINIWMILFHNTVWSCGPNNNLVCWQHPLHGMPGNMHNSFSTYPHLYNSTVYQIHHYCWEFCHHHMHQWKLWETDGFFLQLLQEGCLLAGIGRWVVDFKYWCHNSGLVSLFILWLLIMHFFHFSVCHWHHFWQ